MLETLKEQVSKAGGGTVRAANRYGWDYRRAAAALGKPAVPIIDSHAHLNGVESCRIYDEVRKLFGVEKTYSMTQLHQVDPVRDLLGETVRFIAFPSFANQDRYAAFRDGYIKTIEEFRSKYDSRMLKLWASPRLRDIIPQIADVPYGATDFAEIDAPWRIRACEAGQALGMMFMIHIADPDTWYQTKYNKPEKYGSKRSQYNALERMLDRFENPWIAAHMGGWPEDLEFLSSLLSKHPNLHLDTSATKWIVRELGKHDATNVRAFIQRWRGRLLFGSDLVVQADHLVPQKQAVSPMSDLADSPASAFDLYASRYWALRAMYEHGGEIESPIADPDLAMVDPSKHTPMSAPTLRGLGLGADDLHMLYRDAALNLVERWWARG